MNVWQDLLDVFLKDRCPLCQRLANHEFCPYCTRRLQTCRLQTHQHYSPGPPPLVAWGIYGSDLKRALAALKYENQPKVAHSLGRWLAETWLATPMGKRVSDAPGRYPLVVVPIPLHESKRRQRGYNQAELLAEAFCRRTRLPLQRNGLERIRATEAQFGLSPTERDRNVKNAFRVHPKLVAGKRKRLILLLDDIYTTGATVRAAAQTLRAEKIAVYGTAAVAKAFSN